jgi:hypothetical protein
MTTSDEGPSFFARYIDSPETAPRRRQENPEDRIASTILRALRQTRPNGLNRAALFGLLHYNHGAARLDAALDKLWREGKVRREQKCPPNGGRSGRPAEMWFATQHD